MYSHRKFTFALRLDYALAYMIPRIYYILFAALTHIYKMNGKLGKNRNRGPDSRVLRSILVWIRRVFESTMLDLKKKAGFLIFKGKM